MQNVFIAIIQVGYRSLKTRPPRQGDESDEEDSVEALDISVVSEESEGKSPGKESEGKSPEKEPERKSPGKESERPKKEKSKKMYRKIINADKTRTPIVIGPEEEKVIEKMDSLTNEICSLLFSSYNIVTSSEELMIVLRFQGLILNDIQPILEHFR